MRHYLLALVCLILTYPVIAGGNEYRGEAAEKQIPGAELVWIKDHLEIPSFIKFSESSRIPVADAINWLKTTFELDGSFTFEVLRESNDQLGYSHIRLQQMYRDRPVSFSVYTMHVLNGMVVSFSGDIQKTLDPPEGQFITARQALQFAKDHTGAISYKWEIPAEEEHLKLSLGDPKATYVPQPSMVIVPKNADLRTADYHYAYQMDIYAHQPESRKEIYIDAIDGSVLLENERIHTADTAAIARTAYSDTVDMITDTYMGGFRLNETGRGQGIHTWNLETRTNANSAVEFFDGDNFWENFNAQKDQYATDAHWGAEMTYDYLMDAFNRNSIDGNGFRLNSYVHFDVEWSNASWNGFSMRYGDGTASSKPYTTLDIAGHEIGHGLMDYTADLIYQDEYGALNESFSDILGVSIEFYVKKSAANWFIGENRGTPIRNMLNPKTFGDPSTYGGVNWYNGNLDNGGVHTNSGVQNFWYYLLSEGGNGINDNDSSYSVTGIGIEDAAQIAYRNIDVYLGRVSEYQDAAFFGIQSAVDLYGNCSQQHKSTVNAWFAVGLSDRFQDGTTSDFDVEISTSCQLPFMAQFVNLSTNGSGYTWHFGDGGQSNDPSPAHLYTEDGTYNVTLVVDGGNCGTDSLTIAELINVHPIETPVSDADTVTICPGEVALLSATSTAQEIHWYTGETEATPIFQGPQYQAGPLSTSADYFAEGVTRFPVEKMGPADNTFGNGGFSGSNHKLIFDVYAPMELVSVLVYPQSDKDRYFELRDKNDSLLASKTLFLEQGEARAMLNFLIEPGEDYTLGFADNSGADAYRGAENTAYPYVKTGIAAITGTTAPPQQYYYYFFDWEVKMQDCISSRSKIHALVDNCNTGGGGFAGPSIYPNPVKDGFFVEAYFNDGDYLSLKMYNSTGQLVRDFERNHIEEGVHKLSFSTVGVAPGIYYLTLKSSRREQTEKIVVSE